MILFHGSIVSVETPRLVPSGHTSDFGSGFYLTTDLPQAIRWTQIKMRREHVLQGFVSVFEMSDELFSEKTSVRVKVFPEANEEWLNFVVKNRQNTSFRHEFDVVKGPVANDRVYACLNAFENGFMNVQSVLLELKTCLLVDQISFHTQKALSFLNFRNIKEVHS